MQITKPEEPIVSKLMNYYNGEKHLREAIKSVLAADAYKMSRS